MNENSIIGEDVNEEAENQNLGSIKISLNSDSPEGYYVHTELKNKLTRATMAVNATQMIYFNNARYAKSINFMGARTCYAAKRCAAKGRAYHPENGRRAYKSITFAATTGDVITIR